METIEHKGHTYRVEIVPDEDHGAPWDEEDGHGPVSEWTRRAKLPGEIIIAKDRDYYRYYDFAEACRIARRDGWDSQPFNTGQETRRQQAAKSARSDMKRMSDWRDGYWSYVGVVVTAECSCCRRFTGKNASLWGIESDAGDYLDEVARGLVEEIEHESEAA